MQKQINTDVWPVILPMAVIALANPLHQYLSIPVTYINSLAGLVLFAWFVFYSLGVWRKSIRDKKIYAEKVATAKTQLFGTKQH